jgi:hypothetical protein
MAYSALPAKVASDTITLTNYDNIKDNFAAGVPDIFTTKGDIAVATGADAATRLAAGADDATLVPDASQSGGMAWQIQPAARVYNSGAIDPTTSTWVTLTFDSERFDTDGVHSTSSNTERLTVPAGGAGLYSIGACVEFDTSGIGDSGHVRGIRLLLNGTTVIASNFGAGNIWDGSNAFDGVMMLETLYALSVADYVEVQVYTSWDVNVGATGNYSPEFWLNFERRQ